MSYDQEMAAGRAAFTAGEFAAAYAAFGRAHDLGHAVKRDHLSAHRGMIRAATRAGRLDRAITNIVLMGAAWLFDRGGAPSSSTA